MELGPRPRVVGGEESTRLSFGFFQANCGAGGEGVGPEEVYLEIIVEGGGHKDKQKLLKYA